MGDFLDFRSIRDAMKGVQRVYFCYPPQGDRLLEAATSVAIAAEGKMYLPFGEGRHAPVEAEVISGAREKRPQLDRLIADAHRRKFDALVVWKFGRFACSDSHLLRAPETFKALGIEFVSLSEQVDTSTPTGKIVFTVLGAVAELERLLIAERVKASMRNARAKGKRIGRPPQTYLPPESRQAMAQAYTGATREAFANWRPNTTPPWAQ